MHLTISEATSYPASKSMSVGSDCVSVARATARCISDPRPVKDPTLSRSAARRVACDAMEMASLCCSMTGDGMGAFGGAGNGAPGVGGVPDDMC